MKRVHWALILWGCTMLLSVFTENLFVDGFAAGATMILIWELLRGDKKPTEPPVETPTLTVLYGTSEDRYRYAVKNRMSTQEIILATEPWKLAGLSHCPRIARIPGWTTTLREEGLMAQTEYHLDVLERKYGIPSYDN